jgi:hypothetical protein
MSQRSLTRWIENAEARRFQEIALWEQQPVARDFPRHGATKTTRRLFVSLGLAAVDVKIDLDRDRSVLLLRHRERV